MKLLKLGVKNFRCLKEVLLNFNKNIVIICGNNGDGKTSLLEGIYLTSSFKSFRTDNEKECINFNNNYSKLISVFANDGNKENEKIECEINDNTDKFILNNNLLKNKEIWTKKCRVKYFIPEDIKNVIGSPKEKRKNLNRELSYLNEYYFDCYKKANKLLKQRNIVLKQNDNVLLNLYDVNLATVSYYIKNERKNYISNLEKELNSVKDNFFKNLKNFEIKYYSDYLKFDNPKEILGNIKKNINNDIQIGWTQKGVHRDYYSIYYDGRDVNDFFSQGQLRLLSLVLKLSQIKIFVQKKNYTPILLVDDVLFELDNKNISIFVNELLNLNTQIFFSELKEKKLYDFKEYQKFTINGGVINEIG